MLPKHVPPMADAYLIGNPNAGSFMVGGKKIVYHTTETRGMPNYSDGRSAPHDTKDFLADFLLSHIPHNLAARSLRNDGPAPWQTNRAGEVHQLEMVCYSDQAQARKHSDALWVGDLTDDHYLSVAEWTVWVMQSYSVPDYFRTPRPTPKYGAASPVRLWRADLRDYAGWMGHFEVGHGNAHWDTGAFDFIKLRDIVRDLLVPAPPPLPDPEPEPDIEENNMIINKAKFISDLTQAQVDGWIEGGVIGLIDNDVQKTKDYYRTFVLGEPRDPERADWDNLIRAVSKVQF